MNEPPAPPLRAAARISDHMNLHDLLRLALEIASAGADRLEKVSGSSDPFTRDLRRQIAQLRSAA